jgi:flagellar protein FliL
LVYFLTAKFIVPITSPAQAAPGEAVASKEKDEKKEATEQAGEAAEDHVFTIKDLIINPAGTNGQRYLLTTIGFNMSSEEAVTVIEKREMALRDMLNSILTSKSMDQLIDVSQRDSLRQEILTHAKELAGPDKLKSVYFSKYIIQ